MKSAVLAALLAVSSSGVTAGVTALFPTPLHLVRRIDDPVAGKIKTVDEYCYGNRIVIVSGTKVAIADYGEQVLTEIDHAGMTYSITRFEDIAKAAPRIPAEQSKSTWTMIALGAMTSAGPRPVEAYRFIASEKKLEIGIDRSVALSREAAEVLVGAAYPNRRSEENEQILRAAAPVSGGRIAAQSESERPYGLPADQTTTFENGLIMRNVVLRVDHDQPPPKLTLIDPGAAHVESRLTRTAREQRQLDELPAPRH